MEEDNPDKSSQDGELNHGYFKHVDDGPSFIPPLPENYTSGSNHPSHLGSTSPNNYPYQVTGSPPDYLPPPYQPSPAMPGMTSQYPAANCPPQYPPAYYQYPPNYSPSQPGYYGHPQQQAIMVDLGVQQRTQAAPTLSSVSFAGAISLACVVIWCCGWLCGVIAYSLAVSGQSAAASGNDRSARQYLRASYGFSFAGIVTGIIVIGAVIGIQSTSYNYL